MSQEDEQQDEKRDKSWGDNVRKHLKEKEGKPLHNSPPKGTKSLLSCCIITEEAEEEEDIEIRKK